MNVSECRFFFDYIDPLSYLVERELAGLGQEGLSGLVVTRFPLELRPPPEPLLDPDGTSWSARWDEAASHAEVLGWALREPHLLPWTRKAHELVLHADTLGRSEEVHHAIFEAIFVHGRDIGRVDELIAIAAALGLDSTETKAVLDVDKHSEQVTMSGREAGAAQVSVVPTLVAHGKTLEGFHYRDALRTFLCSP
jgi:predicted DsbA family dithiol-disulfide isomerase